MSELQTDEHGRTIYEIDGAVLAAFMQSTAQVAILCGPVGSGKSKGCCLKLWAIANAQKPGPDGVRRTRMAVVRTTYPELRTTTIRTWLDTFPEHIYGPLKWTQPPSQKVTWGSRRIQTGGIVIVIGSQPNALPGQTAAPVSIEHAPRLLERIAEDDE
jgi:hypothetical protein